MKRTYKDELFTRLLKTWESIIMETSKSDFIKISDESYEFIGKILDTKSVLSEGELETHIEMLEDKLYKCQDRIDFLERDDKTPKEHSEALLYKFKPLVV